VGPWFSVPANKKLKAIIDREETRMSAAFDLTRAAERLVADLMPIAVTVAGDRAETFVAALSEAGAGAEVFTPGEGGFDLAVLLVPPGLAPAAAFEQVLALAAVSDRLLFVPSPPGTTELPDLNAWFELFAEQGFQPVVEYDAAFLGQGAFLVDRNATAAESELASFAERVSLGGALAASTERVAALEAELGDAGDRAALKSALSQRDGALAEARAQLARATTELEELRDQVGAWAVVGNWVAAWATSGQRDTLAALRQATGRIPEQKFWGRLRNRVPPADALEKRLLEEAALVRACGLFDPVWYIASHPVLTAGARDPVLHYVLEGAPAGAAPGPFFDPNAYLAETPSATGNPLVHAIKSGAATVMLSQAN
jgi:hypothetical protein